MASTNDSVLFGVKQIDMINLESDGSADASATEYSVDNPQEFSITAVYNDGERHVLRGGDDVVAVIEEDDKLMGFDVNFTLAELVPEVDGTICGGTATGGSDKWESPASASEEAYPFSMEVWVQKYTEDVQYSDTDGFIKFTFPFCKGRRDTQSHADKSFGAPSYVVRCRKNPDSDAVAMTYEAVASIS